MKLEKSVKDGTTIKTQYAGGFIYNNAGGSQKLQFFSHPEGYVEPVAGTSGSVTGFNDVIGINSSSYKYVYKYKDHSGNVRLTYSDLYLDGAIDPSSEII